MSETSHHASEPPSSLAEQSEPLVQELDRVFTHIEELAERPVHDKGLLQTIEYKGPEGMRTSEGPAMLSQKALARELLKKAGSAEDPLSGYALAKFDIQGLGIINQSGYEYGDLMLQQFAHVLQAYATRHGYLAARAGGDEFMILAPRSNIEQVRRDILEYTHNVHAFKKDDDQNIMETPINLRDSGNENFFYIPERNNRHYNLFVDALNDGHILSNEDILKITTYLNMQGIEDEDYITINQKRRVTNQQHTQLPLEDLKIIMRIVDPASSELCKQLQDLSARKPDLDISKQRTALNETIQQQHFDALTPNVLAFESFYNLILAKEFSTLLCLEPQGLKAINDTYTFTGGNLLIQQLHETAIKTLQVKYGGGIIVGRRAGLFFIGVRNGTLFEPKDREFLTDFKQIDFALGDVNSEKPIPIQVTTLSQDISPSEDPKEFFARYMDIKQVKDALGMVQRAISMGQPFITFFEKIHREIQLAPLLARKNTSPEQREILTLAHWFLQKKRSTKPIDIAISVLEHQLLKGNDVNLDAIKHFQQLIHTNREELYDAPNKKQ